MKPKVGYECIDSCYYIGGFDQKNTAQDFLDTFQSQRQTIRELLEFIKTCCDCDGEKTNICEAHQLISKVEGK